jgi:hypothetical protein
MAPAVGKHEPRRPAAAPEPPKAPVAMLSDKERELRTKLKELRDHVVKNADYVGGKFPEEARKMHYGEIEHRSIYGEASAADAAELIEEGIELHPLPVLPEERSWFQALSWPASAGHPVSPVILECASLEFAPRLLGRPNKPGDDSWEITAPRAAASRRRSRTGCRAPRATSQAA